MERDSGNVTAAFNEHRSALGADCAPADAWPSFDATLVGVPLQTAGGASSLRGKTEARRLTSVPDPARLNLVVAWLPAADWAWSLSADAPSPLPALLYGDKVTLVCPEADELMEVEDFSALYEAFGLADEAAETSPFELLSMNASGAPCGCRPRLRSSLPPQRLETGPGDAEATGQSFVE